MGCDQRHAGCRVRNWRTVRKIATRPRLDWQQSDCDCCDDDRDFILEAQVPWETDDHESPFIYLVVNRGGYVSVEYNDTYLVGRHCTLLEAILVAEEWCASVERDRAKQILIDFTITHAAQRECVS